MKEVLKIFEFVKVLIEEPAELIKVLLSICKLVASVVFSEWLYRYYFGSYQLIDLLLVREWIDFAISGRVFLCMLLFVGSHLLLFSFFPVITLLPFLLIARLVPFPKQLGPNDGKAVGKFITKAGLLKIDYTTGRITATDNTERLADIANSFIDKEERNQMKRFQHSLINELGHTIFVFLFLYYYVLHDLYKGPGFLMLTIVVIIIICFFYLGVGLAFQSMHLIAGDVRMLCETALYEETILEKFKDVNVFLYPADNESIYGAYGCYFAPKMYLFKCLHDKRLGKIAVLQQMIVITKELNKKLLLFTSIDFNDKAMAIVKAEGEWVDLQYFTNEAELKERVAAVIKRDFQ